MSADSDTSSPTRGNGLQSGGTGKRTRNSACCSSLGADSCSVGRGQDSKPSGADLRVGSGHNSEGAFQGGSRVLERVRTP